MSEQGAIAFAERIKSDEAFCERLAAAPDAAARRSIAAEAGYDVSRDDLPAMKAALGLEELSDADLERIAQGTGVGAAAGPEDEEPSPAVFALAIVV